MSAAVIGAILVAAAPWSASNAAHNVNLNATADPSTYYGAWPGHSYFPSPSDWRALPIYQLITDRFADGNPSNNAIWPHYLSDHDPRDMVYRHGGDFAGIASKLDYLHALGMRAIWISPIFQNGYNSYHQYAQTDFTLLDPRLGTLAELRALSDACHARGMYLLIDIVVNHMANLLTAVGHETSLAPFRMHIDEYELASRDPSSPQPYVDFQYDNTWDASGTYTPTSYAYYNKDGVPHMDTGSGTFTTSDFHHNGDLTDYSDAFNNILGKIYGIMDDLRTESDAVQRKLIAMSCALIASADVDGFRIDTPMQVDLGFFKAWAPAVKAFASSELGKHNFGMWGEFYVEIGRYATMMGRGKDHTMHGTDAVIDDVATLNGGIDYAYYHYMNQVLLDFNSGTFPLPESYKGRVDGPAQIFVDDNEKIDLFNPLANRSEYTMWHFCNNHDQWRMAANDHGAGVEHFTKCLGWLTFWPGVPLHYAGDEQGFRSPGTALDGWAREELGASLAWRAMGTHDERDHFDMTHPMFLHIAKLNRARAAWMDPSCDAPLHTQVPAGSSVFAWARGCAAAGAFSLVLVAVNFERTGLSQDVVLQTPWDAGEEAFDALTGERHLVGTGGALSLTLPAHATAVLVHASRESLVPPPVVTAVTPAHDALISLSTGDADETLALAFAFDGAVRTDDIGDVLLDGVSVALGSWCADDATGCTRLEASVANAPQLSSGIHQVELRFANASSASRIGGVFRSRFRVRNATAATVATENVVATPLNNTDPALISDALDALHVGHAAGATHFRARRADQPLHEATDWTAITSSAMPFQSAPDVPTIVQYYADGSSAYVSADCRAADGSRCAVSYYDSMFMRLGDWGPPLAMNRTADYTWEADVPVAAGEWTRLFLVPFTDRDDKFGTRMDNFITRFLEASELWPTTGRVAIASAASWTQHIRVDSCCRLIGQHVQLYTTPYFTPLYDCDAVAANGVCRLSFNDLTLLLTTSADDDLIANADAALPGWGVALIAAGSAALCCLVSLVFVVVGTSARLDPKLSRSGRRAARAEPQPTPKPIPTTTTAAAASAESASSSSDGGGTADEPAEWLSARTTQDTAEASSNRQDANEAVE